MMSIQHGGDSSTGKMGRAPRVAKKRRPSIVPMQRVHQQEREEGITGESSSGPRTKTKKEKGDWAKKKARLGGLIPRCMKGMLGLG